MFLTIDSNHIFHKKQLNPQRLSQQTMMISNRQHSPMNIDNVENSSPIRNMMETNDWNLRHSNNGNQNLHPSISQAMQPNQQQQMWNSTGVQVMGQNGQNIGNQGHKQALQQLMMTMKNQNFTNPDEYQQILNILKFNPQLMAAFNRQRQVGVVKKPNFI